MKEKYQGGFFKSKISKSDKDVCVAELQGDNTETSRFNESVLILFGQHFLVKYMIVQVLHLPYSPD